MRKLFFAGVAAVFAVALGGCETSSNILGGSGPSAALTPPPEAAAPATAQAPAAALAKVAIAPVIGAPDAVGKQLQTQLGTAVGAKNIALASSPADKADYTLRGYVVSAREKSGTKVSYIWDVTDPAGKRVNRITGEEILAAGEGKDPWASVSPQVVQSIADKTAASLATWLPTQKPAAVASATGATVQNAAATTTADAMGATKTAAGGPTTGSLGAPPAGSVTAIVPSVTGAPGDGGVALTSALQRELSRSGVQLSNAPGGGIYKVEGKVAVGEAKDGKQPIQIDWNVKDPAGKKLGTVSQKNEIPQGSLDGAWGKTADAAAAAAAQGILKLLPQQKSTN
jgi:hypothetical protein